MKLKQKNIKSIVKTHISPLLKLNTIITFTGPLGAGKTTIIREILLQAGVITPITSPTFGYVKSYIGANNNQFHHFDLYRINTIENFIESGFDEYLTQEKNTCLIEWPEVITKLFTNKNIINIAITYDLIDQQTRDIIITKK